MRYTADDSAADGHTLLLNGFGHITTQAVSWIGLFVAGKTPADVQDKLNEDINATLSLPDVQAKLIQMGCLPAGSTRQGFVSFLEGEHRRLKTLIEARKIDLE